MHDDPSPESSTSRALGIAPHVLIVASLALQALATTRILCPPQSVAALRPLRVACPPCLWPFTDYPMYSEPHRAGDTLAWIEVRLSSPPESVVVPLRYEVKRASPDEGWSAAFEREERRVRAQLEHDFALPRTADVVLERHRLVFTENGFEGAGDDGIESPR